MLALYIVMNVKIDCLVSLNSNTNNLYDNQTAVAENNNTSANQNKIINLLSRLDYKSLSSSIYNYHFILTLKSIKDRPFGWGINRYEDAVNFYKK